MATSYTENIKSKLDWANVLQRTAPSPLDRSSMFSSYVDAQKYAAGDVNDPDSRGLCGTSYVGQLITVYENGVVSVYKIGENRSLEPMAEANDVIDCGSID